MQTPRLLLVDDDERLAALLGRYLHGHGLDVKTARDGPSGLARALGEHWDLVILDVMLPGMDGFAVLRELRRARQMMPVLMLTARGMDADRIAGLEGGADDYVPKTATAREILARINALLRRRRREEDGGEITAGELTLQPRAKRALKAGTDLHLTSTEFDLLLELALHPGAACRRDELLERVRDREFTHADRSIDVHVAALRRKLGDDPRSPQFIRTVRSVGYMLVPEREKETA
jgi:DNA-binding response OmpR family regulator